VSSSIDAIVAFMVAGGFSRKDDSRLSALKTMNFEVSQKRFLSIYQPLLVDKHEGRVVTSWVKFQLIGKFHYELNLDFLTIRLPFFALSRVGMMITLITSAKMSSFVNSILIFGKTLHSD
jgi:hypothetical protein